MDKFNCMPVSAALPNRGTKSMLVLRAGSAGIQSDSSSNVRDAELNSLEKSDVEVNCTRQTLSDCDGIY